MFLFVLLGNHRTSLRMPTLAYIFVAMVTRINTILQTHIFLKFMWIDDQYKIYLKKIGPHNRYTCIFIYENTFYIAKNNDINIKVNGSLDVAFSILTFNYL